jgi:hypothetical protein
MKNYLKLSLFCLALVLIISGCAQKIKPVKEGNIQSPEKNITTTTEDIKKPDFWGKDVVINSNASVKTITNKKYGYSIDFPVNYVIDEINANPEFLNIGDMAIYVLPGTVEAFNKDFLKKTGPISNLKIEKIKVANGNIGNIGSYNGEGAIKNYRFIISLRDKNNVLFVEKSYEGENISSSSNIFNSVVSTIKID